jgi:hypothetical protein
LTQTLLGIDRLNPHATHEPNDPLAVHRMTLSPQPCCYAPAAIKWSLGKLLVYQAHENLIVTALPLAR